MNTPTPSEVLAPFATSEVSLRSVVTAEWIKFRSVRSNVTTLVAAAIALVALGTLFSSLTGDSKGLPPNATSGTDSLSMSFGAMNLSQLVLGVLGAIFVTTEYGTGLIRNMFAAIPYRSTLIRAKAIVLGLSTWLVMTVASFAVFFAGRASYAGSGIRYDISDAGVFRSILGGGLYGAGIVLLGLGLGFLIRSTAPAIGTMVGLLMITPGLVSLLPDSISHSLGKFLPSNAGQSFMTVSHGANRLGATAGLFVFCGWIVLVGGLATFAVHRRDA